MKSLREYIVIKKLVNNMTNEDGTKVNVTLIRQLIASLSLKYNMLLVKYSCGEFSLPKGEEHSYILDDIFDELAITNSKSIV